MTFNDNLNTTILENFTEDDISWRINFVLNRKYGDQIPKEKGPRAQWVARKYKAKLGTVRGWLYDNRKPREPYLTMITKDTGVETNWFIYGGRPNPYQNIPYEEPEPKRVKLDPNDMMETYTLLSQIRNQNGYSYVHAGEMLERVAIALTQLRNLFAQYDVDQVDAESNMEEFAEIFALLLDQLTECRQEKLTT